MKEEDGSRQLLWRWHNRKIDWTMRGVKRLLQVMGFGEAPLRRWDLNWGLVTRWDSMESYKGNISLVEGIAHKRKSGWNEGKRRRPVCLGCDFGVGGRTWGPINKPLDTSLHLVSARFSVFGVTTGNKIHSSLVDNLNSEWAEEKLKFMRPLQYKHTSQLTDK